MVFYGVLRKYLNPNPGIYHGNSQRTKECSQLGSMQKDHYHERTPTLGVYL